MSTEHSFESDAVMKNRFRKQVLPLHKQYFEILMVELNQILLQFKITVFYCNIFENVIRSCDGKAKYSRF